MKARSFREPALNYGSFVGTVVIENQMHIEAPGNRFIDSIEELPKLRATMPPMTFPNDLARLNVQSGEQRSRAMPFIVMGPAF